MPRPLQVHVLRNDPAIPMEAQAAEIHLPTADARLLDHPFFNKFRDARLLQVDKEN